VSPQKQQHNVFLVLMEIAKNLRPHVLRIRLPDRLLKPGESKRQSDQAEKLSHLRINTETI